MVFDLYENGEDNGINVMMSMMTVIMRLDGCLFSSLQ